MTLHLVAPGLLGPLPRDADVRALPRVARLESALGRADVASAEQGLVATLLGLFGVPPVAGGDAACSYLAQFSAPPPGWVCHAYPVHLVADQERVLVFDMPQDAPDPREAAAFVEAFNGHFVEDGLRLVTRPDGGWFLLAEAATDVTLHDLDQVVGRNLHPFLPDGPDARFWRRLLNETQMLFHGLEVNAQRERGGRLPVSGLWFGGGGVLPRVGESQPPVRASGSGSLLSGLCLLSGVPLVEREEVLAKGGLMLFDEARRPVIEADAAGWAKAVANLDGVLPEVRAKPLEIHPCNGACYRIEPRHRWRWWRRRRLAAFLDAM
jgi:hypothetical protein